MTKLEQYDALVASITPIDAVRDALRTELIPAVPNLTIGEIQPNNIYYTVDAPEGVEYEVEVRHAQQSSFSLGWVTNPQTMQNVMLSGGYGAAYFRVRARHTDRTDLASAWSAEVEVAEPQPPQ